MKKRLLGGLLAAMVILGVLAPAASAAVDGVAAFVGTAAVGDSFSSTCTKTSSAVTGKGLGLPVEGDPPAVTHKNNVWNLSTDFNFLGKSQHGADLFVGGFHACGYLGAPLNLKTVVGATCVSTKGQHGIGEAHAVGTADPTKKLDLKIYNVGWKAALGGTLFITGNYQELTPTGAKKAKHGILYAVVQAQPDDANPLGCLDNTQTTFDVEGVAELTNVFFDKGKYDDSPFGPKKCAGGPCPTPGPRK